jgi:hypothetical protein
MSLDNIESKYVNMKGELFTLDGDKKITTYDCRRFVTVKINNRVLECTFNKNEATVLDVDVNAGASVTGFWICIGEIKACPYS